MFEPFNGTLVHAIDGDSVWINRARVGHVKVRVGGVDVPSSGVNADMAKALIEREWAGKEVHMRPTANYLVHGEIPGIVTMDNGKRNLGRELLQYGERLAQFPIDHTLSTGNKTQTTPSLSALPL